MLKDPSMFKSHRPKSHSAKSRPQTGSKSAAIATAFGTSLPRGLIYKQYYISGKEKEEILKYLGHLYPIWEMRYSKNNPPPPNQKQRPLLRPVYWLGNWQFACLNYYHPPKGLLNRCVTGEAYPPVLQNIVSKIEALVRESFEDRDIPRGWHLNTCLINYYGDSIKEGKKVDCARVGEHKDFEPGPVASISFGERALFQFVSSLGTESKSNVVFQQWLDDSSLQIFGGDRFKKNLFHRVQRVEKKNDHVFPLNEITDFETRRINFTFRYVPDEHIVPFPKLSEEAQEDVLGYMQELSKHSEFFKAQLANLPARGTSGSASPA